MAPPGVQDNFAATSCEEPAGSVVPGPAGLGARRLSGAWPQGDLRSDNFFIQLPYREIISLRQVAVERNIICGEVIVTPGVTLSARAEIAYEYPSIPVWDYRRVVGSGGRGNGGRISSGGPGGCRGRWHGNSG